MEKQAQKEDGQFLITKSDNTQGAADRVSALQSGLSNKIINKPNKNVNNSDSEPQFSIPSDYYEFNAYLEREWQKQDKRISEKNVFSMGQFSDH